MLDDSQDEVHARPVLEEWLRRLSAATGEAFEPDEQGCCWLAFDNNVLVAAQCLDEGPLLSVMAPVAPLPDDPAARSALYEHALRLNAYQVETRGGALALDEDGAILTLCYLEDIGRLDPEALDGLIETARGTVETLRAQFGLAPDLAGLDDTAAPGTDALAGGAPIIKV